MTNSSDKALSIQLEQAPLAELIDAAGRLRDDGHGRDLDDLLARARLVLLGIPHCVFVIT